jgi:GT2 family glycosyltransferase
MDGTLVSAMTDRLLSPGPRLTILIGTYNRLDALRLCLDSIIGKVQCPCEVVVLDAGSVDGTVEYLRQLQGVRAVFEGERNGQAASLNRTLNSTMSSYVCWISDDNVIQPGMLDVAVAVLDRKPGIGMVALKVKDVTGPSTQAPYIGGIWPSGVLNCNQGMLPTDLLKRLGGFDERFRDYGIDPDLTTRVLLAGYQVAYTRRTAIHHYRDHKIPTWIDPEGRERRMQAAQNLYARKYFA